MSCWLLSLPFNNPQTYQCGGKTTQGFACGYMVKTRQVLRASAGTPEQEQQVATLLKHAEYIKSLAGPQGIFEGLTVNAGPLAVALAEMKLEIRTGSTNINDLCETLVYGAHNCTTAHKLAHKVKAVVVVDFVRSQYAALSKYHHKWANLKEAVLSKGWDLSFFDAKRWRGVANLLATKDNEYGRLALTTQQRSAREKHAKRIVGQGAEYLEAYLSNAKTADAEFHSNLTEASRADGDDGKRRLESVLVVPGAFVDLPCGPACLHCLPLRHRSSVTECRPWRVRTCVYSETHCVCLL
jgi:hypothetical protein